MNSRKLRTISFHNKSSSLFGSLPTTWTPTVPGKSSNVNRISAIGMLAITFGAWRKSSGNKAGRSGSQSCKAKPVYSLRRDAVKGQYKTSVRGSWDINIVLSPSITVILSTPNAEKLLRAASAMKQGKRSI